MAEGKRLKRSRRSFTDEFKAGAVRLVLEEGKTVPQVARDLDVSASVVRIWVERARADRGKGKPGAGSGPSRSRIPEHADHRFRSKPITDSGASRSLNA
jgi:transposase